MKDLLTISALALAASPLSAIVLNVPFQSLTFDITTGGFNTALISTPGGSIYQANGVGARVEENLTGISPEADTFYNTFTFTTAAGGAGLYTFSSQFGVGMDGFIALYAGSYNPANPLANAIAANNNAGVQPDQSNMIVPLAAAQTYVLVYTLNNGDTVGTNATFVPNRTINTNIDGPAPITYEPPPPEGIPFGVDSTLGLAVLGAIGALRLRRNRKA